MFKVIPRSSKDSANAERLNQFLSDPASLNIFVICFLALRELEIQARIMEPDYIEPWWRL